MQRSRVRSPFGPPNTNCIKPVPARVLAFLLSQSASVTRIPTSGLATRRRYAVRNPDQKRRVFRAESCQTRYDRPRGGVFFRSPCLACTVSNQSDDFWGVCVYGSCGCFSIKPNPPPNQLRDCEDWQVFPISLGVGRNEKNFLHCYEVALGFMHHPPSPCAPCDLLQSA